MSASTHALNWPVTVLPGKPRAISARRKPPSRQLRARRLMMSVAALCATVTVAGTAQQIAAHGWQAFVFRAPGVGGTPDEAAAASESAASVDAANPAPAGDATSTARHNTPRRHHRDRSANGWGGVAVAPAPVSALTRERTRPARRTSIRRTDATAEADPRPDAPTGDQPSGAAGDDPVSAPPDEDDAPPATDQPAGADGPDGPGGRRPPPEEQPPPRPGPPPPRRGAGGPPPRR